MPPATVSVWILGDQLLHQHPALETARQLVPQDSIHVVLVQSHRRSQRLPYHARKLVLLFSAMRHYADWLRDQGFQVDYVRVQLQKMTFAESLTNSLILRSNLTHF